MLLQGFYARLGSVASDEGFRIFNAGQSQWEASRGFWAEV